MNPNRLQTLIAEPARDLLGILVPPARLPLPWVRWEWLFCTAAAAIVMRLGLSRLGAPSLWHDELVHVHVAGHIAAHGWPALPSGNLYPSSLLYNYVLALFVWLGGNSEFTVRLPSVLLGACNVVLIYLLCRTWLGRRTAMVAVVLLVTSPWHLAWMRQARLYELQLATYLILLYSAWNFFHADPRRAARWGFAALGAYLAGILTSFHSILYLGPVGAYAFFLAFKNGKNDPRWAWAIGACTVLGLVTILGFWLNPNPVDRAAVFQTGLGGALVDHTRADRYYYFRFFANNLSLGFFLVAVLGALSLIARRDWRSLWVVLAFLAPVLVLTYFVGYRRFRFMYFAYPLYVMICAHGLVVLVAAVRAYRRSMVHAIAAMAIVLFLVRLSYSALELAGDCLETASGDNTTLAIKHPEWRRAGHWVRDNRQDGDAVLATTYLPALYYAGQVDNWFPNRYTRWERQESGLEGLDSLEALREFLKENPRGYFIAEASRFMFWNRHGDLVDVLRKEYEWVDTHMTRIAEVSKDDDVCVWRWDFTAGGVP